MFHSSRASNHNRFSSFWHQRIRGMWLLRAISLLRRRHCSKSLLRGTIQSSKTWWRRLSLKWEKAVRSNLTPSQIWWKAQPCHLSQAHRWPVFLLSQIMAQVQTIRLLESVAFLFLPLWASSIIAWHESKLPRQQFCLKSSPSSPFGLSG